MGDVKDREQLELLTTQAYNALKFAVKTRKKKSGPVTRAVERAKQEYESIFAVFKGLFPGEHGTNCLYLNQEQVKDLNRYFLQYAVGSLAVLELEGQIQDRTRPDKRYHENQATLRRALYDRSRPFHALSYDALLVARAGRFKDLIGIIEHIREHYPEKKR